MQQSLLWGGPSAIFVSATNFTARWVQMLAACVHVLVRSENNCVLNWYVRWALTYEKEQVSFGTQVVVAALVTPASDVALN